MWTSFLFPDFISAQFDCRQSRTSTLWTLPQEVRDSVNLITRDNGESSGHLPTGAAASVSRSRAQHLPGLQLWHLLTSVCVCWSVCMYVYVCVCETGRDRAKRSLFSRLMKEADRLFSFWTPERQKAEHYDTNCRYIVTEWTNQSSLSMLVCVCVWLCVCAHVCVGCGWSGIKKGEF